MLFLFPQDGPKSTVSKMTTFSPLEHGEGEDDYDEGTWGITACEHYLLMKSYFDEDLDMDFEVMNFDVKWIIFFVRMRKLD